MARREIDTIWDRTTRNNINDNFIELYNEYTQAGDDAKTALQKAEQALQQAESTQTQLDNIIIESGTSDAEVVQARTNADGTVTYTTLKERLDTEYEQITNQQSSDTTLLNDLNDEITTARGSFDSLNLKLQSIIDKAFEETKRIKIGKIELPSDFPTIPFNIYKKKEGEFVHDATPESIHDWSNATDVYISSITNVDSSTALGETPQEPITLNRFSARFADGSYGSQNDFILHFIDDMYYQAGADFYAFPVTANILMKSDAPNGFTRWTTFRHSSLSGSMTEDWTQVSGSVYKAVVSGNSDAYPVSLYDVDIYNMPGLYKQVSSYTACQNERGTYYLDTTQTTDIYINLKQGDRINDIYLYRRIQILNANLTSQQKMVFQNMFFGADTLTLQGNSTDVEFYFFDCRFYRGLQDTVAFNGIYEAYMLDCVAAYPSKDGFNYHATSEEALAVEVNCGSIGAGKHKFIGGNTTTGSNNGSTAHNGMHMLRVGCWASESEGPTFADIQDIYLINIGCDAYNILDSTTGNRAAFFIACDTRDEANEKPKYIIECRSSGKYYERGIWEQYCHPKYQGFIGNEINQSTVTPIYWEDVV